MRYRVDREGAVWAIPKTRPERKIKQQPCQRGYMKVYLCEKSQVKMKLVHRLVAEKYIPNPENKPQVNHIDGCKANNHVSNLEWCTASENAIHAFQNGLRTVPDSNGNNSGNVKLSEEDVIIIKERLSKGERNIDIAKDYDVHPQTISSIKLGKHRKKR
jgi:hypothetical protein